MLEVLRHQALEGVLATVVRYYGGVKLGAGGLLRAYTEAIVEALKNAERLPIVKTVLCEVKVPYALEGSVRRLVDRLGGVIEYVAHEAEVRLTIRLPITKSRELMDSVTEQSGGRAELRLQPL
jgi:putative IMPACT (imprinted ancient) family translation regulator